MFDDAHIRAKKLDIDFQKTKSLKGPLHGVPISVRTNVGSSRSEIAQLLVSNPQMMLKATIRQWLLILRQQACPKYVGPRTIHHRCRGDSIVKTNVPQSLYACECSNPLWGQTSNPYNADFTSGGSSGGEACMLALDAAVIGLGSDIAGSLRIPASYCGIYFSKPGFGRISDHGAKESFPGLEGIKSVGDPMRCMDDLELACRVTFGAAGAYGDFPPVPFRDVNLPKKLCFGYYTSDGVIKASPASARAVRETIAALELAGHECVELDQHFKNYVELTSADGYKNLLKEQFKGSDPLDVSLSMLTFGPKVPRLLRNVVARVIHTFMGDGVMSEVVRLGGSRSIGEYYEAVVRCNEIKKQFRREFWVKYNLDGIITYVHASPQTRHGGSKMLSVMSAATLTYNLVDSPVGVVPVTRVNADTDAVTDEWINGRGHGSSMCENELYFKGDTPLYDPVAMHGMPIGVQIVGKPWEDEKVLAMMRVVDDALGKQRGFGPGSSEERLRNRERRTA